jgi:hypothetical protein
MKLKIDKESKKNQNREKTKADESHTQAKNQIQKIFNYITREK